MKRLLFAITLPMPLYLTWLVFWIASHFPKDWILEWYSFPTMVTGLGIVVLSIFIPGTIYDRWIEK